MVFPEKDNSMHRLVVIAGCLVRELMNFCTICPIENTYKRHPVP